METPPPVHIRASNRDFATLCALPHAGESISQLHYTDHVLETKTDCCAALYARLCAVCRALTLNGGTL